MKCLITAETVRQEHIRGNRTIEVVLPQCIVTAEARLVAEQLHVKIIETLENRANGLPPAKTTLRCTDADLAKIKAEVLSRLPANSVSEEIIEQMVRKLASESAMEAKQPGRTEEKLLGEAAFDAVVAKSGIKKVAGDSVRFGLFEGAGQENQVGITDVITASDGSSMAAGFMRWKKCFFPWTLTYDEVDYVIEGELHIRCGGETVVGKAGDVIFIPRNTTIEFGTTSEVHFLYVAYPANWQDA